MNAWEQRTGPAAHRARRRDWGRTFARFLCLAFALIGLIPMTGSLLIQSEPLKKWAARETTRVLRHELGMEATFAVELSFIPLRLAITDLTVPATDGGTPAVEAGLAAVSPRFFSLLAGRLDVGDIELENTKVRLVIVDGEVENVAYRFPETQSKDRPKLTRSPFRSLAITNAQLDLTVDGTRIRTKGIDIDAFAEKNLAFDIALRTGETHLVARRTIASSDGTVRVAHDEDRICAIDGRAVVSPEEVLIRRFSLLGTLDLDEAEGTLPPCGETGDGQLAVRMSQTKISLNSGAETGARGDGAEGEPLPEIRSHLMARLPLAAVGRLVPGLEGTGWAGFSGDIRTTNAWKLPEVVGKITGENLSLNGHAIARELKMDLLVSGDVVSVPAMYAKWGNGEAWFEEIEVKPFEEKIPLSIAKATTKAIDFPGVMRDVAITSHSWVDWNFGDTVLEKVAGTISPFYIDGGVQARTHGFAVYDRGFDDPAKKRMVGIDQAQVAGRFRAHQDALEFYQCDVQFGESRLPVELVSVGLYEAPLIVRLKEGGGRIDLEDVSPIADIELKGKADIFVDLAGPMTHPILEGTLAVDGLVIDEFEAGNVEESDIHFEPLFVEFTNLKGHKGAMDYQLPSARLSFDGPASVEFTAAATSRHFVAEEFFDVFHFDEDPRFEGIAATGSVSAQVRYLMGGPEDTCPDGRLMVSGTTEISEAEFLGEKFNGGTGQFSFEWFDFDAGTRGMRIDVPSLSLHKGSGAIFASLEMHPGGLVTGDVVGTRVPVSRIDSLGDAMNHADGFVTGSAQIGGTADALSFLADIDVTPLKSGKIELPSSRLSVRLVPEQREPDPGSIVGTSSCGRTVFAPYGQVEYERDLSDGTFFVSGELLGGQIALDDMSITRQRKKIVRGHAELRSLDLGRLAGFVGGALVGPLPAGSLSGDVNIESLSLDDPYASTASIALTETSIRAEGLEIALLDDRARIEIAKRKITSKNLALVATTRGGQKGTLDAKVSIDDQNGIAATLDLRPTSLGVVAAALPGVDEADGELTASVSLTGPVSSPIIAGFIDVQSGNVAFSGFQAPVTDIDLTVALDDAGLHVAQGTARWGGGSIVVRGEAPLVGERLGRTNLAITARNVTLPMGDEIRASFDANLGLLIPAPSSEDDELPKLTGNVTLLSGSYEKPMRMTADISTLASRGEKTEVEGYDPEKDQLNIDVLLRSSRPLRVENELVAATLRIDPTGLRITGTDQRFGAVGSVEVEQGGQVFLRRNEFEIQRGLVRFNDPTRLHAEVDVTAVTEYRRYEDRGSSDGSQANTDASSGAPVAGNWRIMMHAYGPPEDLKVDLNSDPPLAQDDIFLLLTVGLTRTELDQTQNSGVGSAVALEALGSLSGAESAVTRTVPVDEFRFGSNYSSRSGRTEPTLTIGKRLSRRIRASVTTTLADSSEVRSHVELRATENLSFEGSYDNAGDVASATGGNLGGDVRWRLEFQ